MKLYYSPGACSQAPHILMHEIGISHDAAKVDLKSKIVEDGRSYLQVNPKGVVPALELNGGEVLTENAVILQYLGDRSGSKDFLPPVGDFRRYKVLEAVNFITTELHKPFGLLFKAVGTNASEEIRQFVRDYLAPRLDHANAKLSPGPYWFGEELSLPDPYLFVIVRWTEKFLGLDRWSGLASFREHMVDRPAVRHVLRFEGLLEKEAAD
jgi:glutathione S-transferase